MRLILSNDNNNKIKTSNQTTLHNEDWVKDNCGFGLIAHLEGEPSHKIVRTAITSLARMQHRGGVSADGKTGDGCGLLMQKPDQFFSAIAEQNGWRLGKKYAVGNIFFSTDVVLKQQAIAIITKELEKETLQIVGWRQVPTNNEVLGEIASQSLPDIQQVFINAPPGWRKKDFERRLYMARRRIEQQMIHDPDFYIPSLSCLVTIYKGLVMPKDLADFYLDLADIRMSTAICVFHQRFSTNTTPQWKLAQPFRFLAHNGEINTIKGNRQWAQAREYKFHSPLIADLKDAAPFVNYQGSDSASLDNMLELFLAGGMDLFRAMRLLVPPAYQKHPHMDKELKSFYEFNSMHMEPWDGPAGIVITNGRHVACNLDRNGLRPARYIITKDKLLTLASESGIWDYTPDEVIEQGRVGPGEMLAVDTYNGKVWYSDQIDHDLKDRHPYNEWLEQNIRRLIPFEDYPADQIGTRLYDDKQQRILHKLFNYTYEEIEQVIKVLACDGQEATGSMGDDTPMAVMSQKVRDYYDYFRQQFAQVTNPPIDPLRESHVMSLATCIGREQNVFAETSGYADRVLFNSPVLMYTDIKQLKEYDQEHYRSETFSLCFNAEQFDLKSAIQGLCKKVAHSVAENKTVIVTLSDKNPTKDQLVIPAPLAIGAVQETLVTQQLRCDTNIIVETGGVRNSHQLAVLIGLGATAVYPYLAYETVEQYVQKGDIPLNAKQAMINYRQGLNKGLLKIMSKMGISTVASYRCSNLFELIGIGSEIMSMCFPHIVSRIGGAEFVDVQSDLSRLNKYAWLARKELEHGGFLKYVHGGEYHAYNPDVVQLLQKAVQSGNTSDYQAYADAVNNRPASHFRDLFKLNSSSSIPLEQVEPVENLFPKFDSAAMSIGALSPEAHEALAVAMNRLGGFSNSGEGGEDPKRFGTVKNSKIKQIASGRFGVTPHYLRNAEVIQIKVAQGAKPGEGGQLPGEKVSPEIAKLRFSIPGVTLISPPPHHDIYSIEDLAQLIFDLKQVNPKALISVKLVSEPGVGTIATGVAKANADLITISGFDGGTGASPLTSVKHAGCPWELGLAEVHQALVENGLRHKVRLQVDGGLKTGLDIVKAAILGAETFGFGTGPMVALGCKYLRICHLNNCATGVATQDQTLRQRYFIGLPEMVENYFKFIGSETREHLASLGVANLVDLIGRTDLLEIIEGQTAKQQNLALQNILDSVTLKSTQPLYQSEANIPADTAELNCKIVADTKAALKSRSGGEFSYPIRNTDRSVPAQLSGEVAAKYGNQGMAGDPIKLNFVGTAGQSFGVWNAGGVNLQLTGDANDYVGKGMTGGTIVIHPPQGVAYLSHVSAIMGNTCLYGATGGKLLAAGCAGERFAVRNSGANAVIEGAGENACEYMTGGTVVVLGSVGINFGAGMTGGFAYLLDEDGTLDEKINPQHVEALELPNQLHIEFLRGLINDHYEATQSTRSLEILSEFSQWHNKFKLVKPKSVDVDLLLGHRQRSSNELRIEAM